MSRPVQRAYNRRGLLGSFFGRRQASSLPVTRLDRQRALPTGVQHGRFESVRIDANACLAGASMSCTVCSEQCPVPGAIVRTDAAPQIDPNVCTGCGVCVTVCPAPSMAIRITPKRRSTS